MPSRKKTTQEKPLVKRLLDGLIPKRTAKWKSVIAKITEDDSESSVDNELVTRSASEIKRHEDVPQKSRVSPDPTLEGEVPSSKGNGNKQDASTETPLMTANSQFYYSPMYRRYFGLTPPNPQLCNPRLLEDYIDWYINVYMEEEEMPWTWIDVGNARERREQSEQEAKDEANRLASRSPPSSKHK
ncbi:unnamed protein product [Adineta ricciae]|uniref:Uncharacterized protein n=1 Tax=Adineta ricciae TaxID=249248 RepID=A0A815U0B8_ADIRI|nr:unnamed protein product [Adineta ricciae]